MRETRGLSEVNDQQDDPSVTSTPNPAKRVILAQTDTTVGFLSQDSKVLAKIKQRSKQKPFLRVFSDLGHYKASSERIPKRHRSRLRRSRRVTYVVKGKAIRIIHDHFQLQLFRPSGWAFSTSANQAGHGFERDFCESAADIIVEESRGLCEGVPSSIERLGKVKRRRLR